MAQGLMANLLRAGRAQFLGMGAQVLGAAPVIVMSIYLSRTVSLATVADFAMLIGVSSIAFTMGMIGLRSRLVLDQFRDFSEDGYFALRGLATLLMTVAIIATGSLLGAPFSLVLAVAVMRAGDAALDLVMAFDQVRRDLKEHMYSYIGGASIKLTLLIVFMTFAELLDGLNPFLAFTLASTLHCIYAWNLFLRRRENTAPLFQTGICVQMLRLVRVSAVFAVAQIICAVLTSAPRLVLPVIADRDLAGAAGAALSVATVVGMAYFAVWLRWVPNFGKEGFELSKAIKFVAEMLIGLCVMLVLIWLLGAPVMGIVYGLSETAHLSMTRDTLLASAVFFFVMTLANLFKPTQLPWAESIVYLGGVAAVLLFVVWEGTPQIPALLLAAAAGMLATEAAALAFLKITKKVGARA